jgi:hypothetical protein
MMNAVSNPDFSIRNFEAGDIDPDRFDHEAHVYVGWLYIREFPLAEALAKFDAALQRLVIKLGADGKYHTTLTWFFLLVIAERAQPDQPWNVFKRRNADLLDDSKRLLSRYYSEDLLFSENARERFVLPNNLATQ